VATWRRLGFSPSAPSAEEATPLLSLSPHPGLHFAEFCGTEAGRTHYGFGGFEQNWDLNSGLHTSKAGTLLFEPALSLEPRSFPAQPPE
jgi:hypothetical protein